MPAPIDPDTPTADIRIGYARCSSLAQELQSQLDALAGHGIPRDKIFSEKRSTRVRDLSLPVRIHPREAPHVRDRTSGPRPPSPPRPL
ncbi:hypothetical protein [Streptomyces sp. NPDC048442]|uniref:hypothetical protein n=1 Tax=Streptomyces sp. NPDC048442 TaxID=3154823 RepID=UPI00344983CB